MRRTVPKPEAPHRASGRWCLRAAGRILRDMNPRYDHTDFSVVVKNRAPPPKAWRWEIYRAGRSNPIECSSVYFETATAANQAGKKALQGFLSEFPE
jgi:hypothetical protein